MPAKALMIQGTASHVGKTVVVTALCRLLASRGLRVAPFKAQNMALNSYVTAEGREIGWAQAVQAWAAGLMPQRDFNPVLLKPNGESRCQVIVHGKPMGNFSAREYERMKRRLWPKVTESLARLQENYDVIVIEGAGSPAEINLAANDISNMRVARHLDCPVLLVGDIDRGGVFASLKGTLDLLPPSQRRLVKGLIINKFRGDVGILRPGIRTIETKTGKKVLGVLPHFDFPYQDQEDSMALETESRAPRSGKIKVAVIRTPRIANFTDFDALRYEDAVDLRFVRSAGEMDNPDWIILPGTKNTLEDLRFLRRSGLAGKVRKAAHRGKLVLGVCGGFQMLGRTLRDPLRVESRRGQSKGLGLLDVHTVFGARKSLHQIDFTARACSSRTRKKCTGYEIHMGQTTRGKNAEALHSVLRRDGQPVREQEGCLNKRGNVMGTYVHGLLANDGIRHALLRKTGRHGQGASLRDGFEQSRQLAWNRLAKWARDNLDMQKIDSLIGLR